MATRSGLQEKYSWVLYSRIDAEMKRKVFEEKVPNYTPNTTMPWEEDEDLLQWLTQFGKKTF